MLKKGDRVKLGNGKLGTITETYKHGSQQVGYCHHAKIKLDDGNTHETIFGDLELVVDE